VRKAIARSWSSGLLKRLMSHDNTDLGSDNSETPMVPKQFEHWVFRVSAQAKEKFVIGSEDAFSVVAPI
jgi:hypothetical protein